MQVVKDVMSTNVISLQARHRLYQASEIMKAFKVRHIPIVDMDSRVLGIVSEQEISRHSSSTFGTEDESLVDRVSMTRELGEVMNKNIVHVRPLDSVELAIELMRHHKIRSVLVINPDTDRLEGILTDSDLLDLLQDTLFEKAVHQRQRVTFSSTPAPATRTS